VNCIIAYRIKGGKVEVVNDPSGDNVAVFSNYDVAVDYIYANSLFQSGQADHQIISLDEL
jgi:hypothetical protein